MKKLELEVIAKTRTHHVLVIKKQTHFGEEFGTLDPAGQKHANDVSNFFLSDGVLLYSPPDDSWRPFWTCDCAWGDSRLPCLHVLGGMSNYSELPIPVTNHDAELILRTVKAYNDFFREIQLKKIIETVSYVVGQKEVRVSRYVSAPMEGVKVFRLSATFGSVIRNDWKDDQVYLTRALHAGFLFPSAIDARAFLCLNKISTDPNEIFIGA